MKCSSYNKFFETIANKTRLAIIGSLSEKDLSVGDICEISKEEQSKISHNLKILLDCNFVNVKRSGKKRVYSLNKDTVLPIIKLVDKHVNTHCCKNCQHKKENKKNIKK